MVANDEPVIHAIIACAPLCLMWVICAATLISLVLKCSRSTISMFLFSGVENAAFTWRSPSCPDASVEVMSATLRQPRSR
jgi:hypothetical protein